VVNETNFRSAVLTAALGAALVLAGCAGDRQRDDASAGLRMPPSAKLAKSAKPYDQPAEAQQYYADMRLPEGETAVDAAWYETALAAAGKLEWYASANDRRLATRDPAQLRALSTWTPLGPGNIGGRTRVIRFEPGNPNTMYIAGVAGGVWKSTNAGQSWLALNDLAPNIAIVSMAIDRTNVQRLWVGTGEGVFNADAVRGAGIFVSNNGGLDFERLVSTNTPDFLFVNDLVQSPTDAATLYAATRSGLWVSRDAGTSFTRAIDTTTGASTYFGGCFDIDARTVGGLDEVVVSCGTFRQLPTDSGAVFRNPDALDVASPWTPVLQPAGMARTMLARAPSDGNVVYALAAAATPAVPNTNDGLLGIWRSIDGGATWTNRLTNAGTNANNNLLLSNPVIARLSSCFGGAERFLNQGWYDNVIAVDPLNPDRVWVGGVDLFRSDDGGQNFGVASYWWFFPDDPNYAHADQHALAFHPDYNGTTNRTLYVGNDGGIQRSDNADAPVGTNTAADANNSVCGNANLPQVTWASLNNNYAITQFYYGTVYPDSRRYIGGTQDNGTLRGDEAGGPIWDEVNGGDGSYTAVNPTDPRQVFFATTGISIRRSDNDGVSSVSAIGGISDAGLFINPFTMDLNTPSRLWTSGRRMWRTENSGTAWVAASATGMLPTAAPFTTAHRFSTHAVAPGLSDLVIVGTNQGQIRRQATATTATGTTTWDIVGAPVRLRPGFVGDIAFDASQAALPADQRTAIAVFATFNGVANPNDPHVFRSTDGGTTWTGIDGTGAARIPNVPVHTAVIDPTSNGQRIFVGTDIGVFVTTDGGATWLRENAGFANTVVEELVLQREEITGRLELVAFTHGRSAYRTVVAELNPQPRTEFVLDLGLTPSSLGVTDAYNLLLTVTPGTSPASTGITVTADLSSVGGSSTAAMNNGPSPNVFVLGQNVTSNTAPGPKAIPVTVRDRQGRTAIVTGNLTVLAPTSPSGVGSATPAAVSATESTLLAVTVTPGTNPTVVGAGITVTANLTSIGGATAQALLDNGTGGDLAAGDGIYSATANVALGTPGGTKALAVSIADTFGRNAAASITLDVNAATALSGNGGATPSDVLAGASTLLTYTVTPGTNPASSGIAVAVDVSALGGTTLALVDDGTNGDAAASDNVYSRNVTVAAATAPGVKTLPVTVVDAQNRSAAGAIALNVSASGMPRGASLATPATLQPGTQVRLTVFVTPGTNPPSTGLAVTVDLTSIGGSATQAFSDAATNGDQIAGDNVFTYLTTVPAATASAVLSLPVTITDAQARTATSSLALDVRTDGLFGNGFED